MVESHVLQITREGLYLVLLISAPPILASLLIGLVISLFQAMTQLQEQTLTFAPKLVVVFGVLPLVGPWIAPYLALMLKEVLVGLTIGFVAGIFDAVRSAGTLIDTAGGANLATVMVPEIKEQASLFANLQFQLAIVVFFAVGGHRLFLTAV